MDQIPDDIFLNIIFPYFFTTKNEEYFYFYIFSNISKRWCKLVQLLKKAPSINKIFSAIIFFGHSTLLENIYKQYKIKDITLINGLYTSASFGYEKCMIFCKNQITNLNKFTTLCSYINMFSNKHPNFIHNHYIKLYRNGKTYNKIQSKTYYIENYKYNSYGMFIINNALNIAAEYGHIHCMNICKDWGANEFHSAMISAASTGQDNIIDICTNNITIKFIKNFEEAFAFASANSHIKCMEILDKLIVKSSTRQFYRALSLCIQNRNIEYMKILKKWMNKKNIYIDKFGINRLLETAAEIGHIDSIQLCIKWGATPENAILLTVEHGFHEYIRYHMNKYNILDDDFKYNFAITAEKGYIECMKIFREFDINHILDIEDALYVSIENEQINAMKLCKNWMEDDGYISINILNHILNIAIENNYLECIQLCKQWVVEYNKY